MRRRDNGNLVGALIVVVMCAIVYLCLGRDGKTNADNESPPDPWTVTYSYTTEGRWPWWQQTAFMKVPGGTLYRCYLTRSCNDNPAVSVSLVLVPDKEK